MVDNTSDNIPKEMRAPSWTMKFNRLTAKYTLINLFNYGSIIKRKIMIDFLICSLSFISIFISFQEAEMYYELTVYNNSSKSLILINSLRVINCVFSIIICLLIYMNYKNSLRLSQKSEDVSMSQLMLRERLCLIIEIIISLISDPPYLNFIFEGPTPQGYVYYQSSTIFSSLSFIKGYHFVKLYTNYTVWLSQENQIKSKKYGVNSSVFFAVKADLKLKPLIVIIPLAVGTVFLAGYIIRNMERGYITKGWEGEYFKYATNGWWCAIITMTTVGYGDVYPKTDIGRLFICITGIVGLVLISLYVAALNSAVSFNKQEFHSYLEIKRIKSNIRIQHTASNIIKTAASMLKAKKNRNLNSMFLIGIKLKHFANHSIQSKHSLEKYIAPSEMLLEIEKKLERDINFVKQQFIDVKYIGEKLKIIQKEQKKIEASIDDVLSEQRLILNKFAEYNIKGYAL
ncbi:hypothetical protein SteCoe_756 [Stentor coeruleus]|uniref:Potassium channel domain-containing protein n=1 Tax=Stentor coeruleus TaxID=5963 RepID=A0A1R2D354_9CILI|nr:hypothetical protein SteCoe_756 [Stentor coeruleus]